MKLIIYGHGGSQNHGNEAIVRGVRELFPEDQIILYSFSKDEDERFDLDDICEIRNMSGFRAESIWNILLKLFRMFFGKTRFYFRFFFHEFIKTIDKDAIYCLEAGDQYCELGMHRKWYAYLNQKLRKSGAKTVMLGCSVNQEILKDKKVQRDIKTYSLVVARESLTYNALNKEIGTSDLILAPCPAFRMPMWKFSEKVGGTSIQSFGAVDQEYIGINVGFLAQGNETKYEKVVAAYEKVIQYIIRETNYSILLIPHVDWNYPASDTKTLKRFYKEFITTDRIELCPMYAAPKQKYIMSQCKYMIALRTHASISAMAAFVPTILTGYKSKTTGIATDIYKDFPQLLVHIDRICTGEEILESFQWMEKNGHIVREYMHQNMDSYIKRTKYIKDKIAKL